MSESLMTGDPASNPQDGNPGNENDWRAGLPEELRADPSLATFKDVGSLAKSFVYTKKMVNEKGLILPKDESPPEDWEQFYNTLGRPESPDKYEFGEAKLPEGHEIDPEMEKAFREQAHQAGLTAKQAAALRDWYVQQAAGQIEGGQAAGKASIEKAKETLQKEWGRDYEANLTKARQAFNAFVPEDTAAEVKQALAAGPGNDPHLIKVFYNVALAMSEDTLKGRGGAAPQNAMEKALELTRHPAYIDNNHPEHKRVIAEATHWFQKAYPEND